MQNGKQETTLSYKKTSFKAGVILPDAPAGEWEVTIVRDKTTIKPDKNGSPMVTFTMRLDTAAEESNESFQGTTLPFRVFFLSDEDNSVQSFRKNRGKRDLAVLADNCGFDLDIIPDSIGGEEPSDESVKEDLAAFVEAVEGKSFTAWTSIRPNKDTNEPMVNISLTKPGAAYGAPAAVARSNDDEDEGSARPAKKSKKNRA